MNLLQHGKIRRNMGPLHHSSLQHVKIQELLRTTSWSTEEGEKSLAVLGFTGHLPLSGCGTLQKNILQNLLNMYISKMLQRYGNALSAKFLDLPGVRRNLD